MRFRPCLALLLFLAPIVTQAPASAGTPAAPGAAESLYIVQFTEPALARYNSTPAAERPSGPASMPSSPRANGRMRLDPASPAALSYVAALGDSQQRHLADIGAVLGRSPMPRRSLRHALDAVVLALSQDEADRVARIPGVAAVDADRQYALESDIGPRFTGAESVWWGSAVAPDAVFAADWDEPAFYGDGVVVGMIDSGYNSLSPSFQAVDANGYRIRNPLGQGVYLGQCNVPGISLGGCNDKVIGVYDEAGLTTTLSGWKFSVEDIIGHGSHTASVAAGDLRRGTFNGYSASLSGVAPHANLVIFRACTPTTLCSGSAMLGSVDQAIADGVVDVLNFSISDEASPWSDPIAHAFLAAQAAGIAVVTAGGNFDSGYSLVQSVNNTAPWVVTVAASTHTGGAVVDGLRSAVQPDELAAFSLLGPARFDVIKPDLQAPGTEILGSAWNMDGTTSGAERLSMMNGTSASAAHVSGSVALLLGEHPDWTPMEAKSALMLTAVESGLTKPDGATPSDYFDRGTGRVREDLASRVGLVMDENAADFADADPTWGVGDPASLNLASIQDAACKSACNFTRTFRSTQDHVVNWNADVLPGPAPGFSSVSVTPRKISVNAGALATVKFGAKTSGMPADGAFHFAEVVLTPDDPRLSPIHLVVAVAVPH